MTKPIDKIDDSLLGGAAMSIDDLEIVESQEIRWLFLSGDNESDNIKNIY